MSLMQIRKAIEELSAEEKHALREWLSDPANDADEDRAYELEGVKIAQSRLEELTSGKVKGLTHDEFWAAMKARQAVRA